MILNAEKNSMKVHHHIIFGFLLFVPVFLTNVSCSKKNLQSVAEDVIEEPVVLENFIEGKILSKRASLCLFGRDEKMHPVITLSQGAEVFVLEVDGLIDIKNVPDLTKINESENAQDESSDSSNAIENSTEYFHVVYDNMDFWLEKSVLAMQSKNAVVIEKTFLYQDESLLQKIEGGQNYLNFASRIALPMNYNEKESQSSKIFYYDTNLKSVRDAFVSSSSISTREDDIVVSQVVESLKVTTRALPRNELFARAAKYKPHPKVLAALNAQKTETKTYNYQEVVNSLKTIRSGVNVNELLTVDQSKDPFR